MYVTKKVNVRSFILLFFLSFQAISFSQDKRQEVVNAFSKSYEFEALQKYESAIKSLEKVYSKSLYEINLRLGWLHYLNAEHTTAAKYYKIAISLEPKSIEARMGLAYPLSYLGNWDEIVKVYGEILKIDPKNYKANLRLGTIWYNRKKFSQALPYVKILSLIYPFDYDVNLLAGKIYISQGKIVEAKAALTKCINYDPTSEEANNLIKGL